jgi:hypothetical protein
VRSAVCLYRHCRVTVTDSALTCFSAECDVTGKAPTCTLVTRNCCDECASQLCVHDRTQHRSKHRENDL